VGSENASFLQQSAYQPFKVIQGRRFWYQSKARMRLPISYSYTYLAHFPRYVTYWLKITKLSYSPLSLGSSSLDILFRSSRWSLPWWNYSI